MKKRIKVLIVTSNVEDVFAKKIEGALEAGYKCVGSMAVTTWNTGNRYYQQMHKQVKKNRGW